jgi:hypothetical protein
MQQLLATLPLKAKNSQQTTTLAIQGYSFSFSITQTQPTIFHRLKGNMVLILGDLCE